jgi:hypothetical protein
LHLCFFFDLILPFDCTECTLVHVNRVGL